MKTAKAKGKKARKQRGLSKEAVWIRFILTSKRLREQVIDMDAKTLLIWADVYENWAAELREVVRLAGTGPGPLGPPTLGGKFWLREKGRN